MKSGLMKRSFIALALLSVTVASFAQPVTDVLILTTVNAGNSLVYPSLKAKLANNNVAEISWDGLKAIKVIRYELEKSADGENFGYVAALPCSNNLQNQYSFKDKYLFEGNNYYRLKIVNIKGDFSYTNPVSFNSNELTQQVRVLSTVAVKNLLVWMPANTFVSKAIITDLVRRNNLVTGDLASGSNLCSVNIEGLKPGLYQLSLQTNKGTISNLKFSKK